MAIRGNIKLELSVDTILSKISKADIYHFYFGSFKVNEVMFNHLRGEKGGNPSFVIGNKGRHGELRHHDFGDSNWCGDCFDLVRSIYNCSLWEACIKIDVDFGLGISSTPLRDYKKIVSKYSQPEELGKRYSLIQVVTRKFTKEELAYWQSYYQTEEDLRANHVYSIKEIYLNKRRYPIEENELRFGYLYNSYWKIYKPYPKNKKDKWLSNVPITILDGKEELKSCDTLFITKSKKDRMVLQKLYPCVISTQNESLSCFSKDNIDLIKSKSKRQILMYDSDEPGVNSSLQITKLFNFDYCNVPRKYLVEGIKDWSDLCKNYDLDTIKIILKNKGL